jgi:hypothetical protein
MYFGNKKALAVAIAIVMALASLPLLSNNVDADSSDRCYGNESAVTMKDVDSILKELTGKTLDELIASLTDYFPGYEISIVPSFESDFALERNTTKSGSEYTIEDHFGSYVNLYLSSHIKGNLPDAGTYYPKDDEGIWEFLFRLIQESKNEHTDDFEGFLGLYTDLTVVSKIDLNTGELTSVDVRFKLMIVEHEEANFNLDIVESKVSEEEDEKVESITFSYDKTTSESNIYTDIGVKMDIEGLKIINDSDTWSVNPKIKEHVYRSVVSSDLANGLWQSVLEMVDPKVEKVKARLPELILHIISSGERMLDLFDTIKSLTGKSIPDVFFVADLAATKYTDDYGYEYTILDLKGTETTLYFPLGGYALNTSVLIYLVPSSILPDAVKDILYVVFTVLGWGTVEIGDITDDKVMQSKCENVFTYVKNIMKYDEEYTFKIPAEYLTIGIAGLLGSFAAFVLIWRRWI